MLKTPPLAVPVATTLRCVVRSLARWGLVSVIVLFLCPVGVLACHIEYSDWLVNVFRQQGVSLDKRVGNYASLVECEAALRQAVSQSGDSNLANNMSCVDCSQPNAAPSPSAAPPSNSTYRSSQGGSFQGDSDKAEAREKERQEAFNKAKEGLIGALKGQTAPSALTLKTAGSSGAGLTLKSGRPPAASHHSASSQDDIQEKVRQAQFRIAQLIKQITGIQTLLRQYTKSLTNNSAEFEKWGSTVDEAYHDVLINSKEYVTGLFLEYSLLGSLKTVQKESFRELGRLAGSADPKIRNWLNKELGGRSVEFAHFEKLVKLGQAEGDFAGLLNTEKGTKKNLDALILVNDLLDVVGQGVPGGALQHARMIGATYADLTSISYSWFAINRLTKDTAKLSREVDSLSYRMRHAMNEMECLDGCAADYTDRCMERCTGKTRLHSPPPLPR